MWNVQTIRSQSEDLSNRIRLIEFSIFATTFCVLIRGFFQDRSFPRKNEYTKMKCVFDEHTEVRYCDVGTYMPFRAKV